MVKITTQQMCLIDSCIVTKHHSHREILLDVSRQVACRQYGEHYHTQKNEHQHGAYT